jgi:hypothetical protein
MGMATKMGMGWRMGICSGKRKNLKKWCMGGRIPCVRRTAMRYDAKK